MTKVKAVVMAHDRRLVGYDMGDIQRRIWGRRRAGGGGGGAEMGVGGCTGLGKRKGRGKV